MENNGNEKATFNNPFEKFLTLCSGASVDILKDCPRTEVIKHAGIGGTIFITSLLALISGSYALFTVFKNYPAAILFGLVWALMIFNLDRLIVSSMRKRGSWKEQFKMAIPRILLALVIAVVISKPLEVRLLETKIDKTLSSSTFNTNENLAKLRDKKEAEYTNKINTESKKIQTFQSNKPTMLVSLEQEEAALKIKEKSEKAKADKKNKSNYFLLNNVKKGIAFRKVGNPTSAFVLNEIQQLKKEKEELNRKINLNYSRVRAVREKLKEVQKNKKKQFISYNNQLEELELSVKQEINRLKEQRKQDFKEFDELANEKMEAFKNNSLIDQIDALSLASKENNSIAHVSLFIMLLFIVVETAPIFVKLISPRGPYDELLDASEYEIEIRAKDTMNITTRNHNKKFDILVKIDEQDIKQEVSNNKAILETISNAHHVLIQDQVDDWLEKERSKLKNNKPAPSSNGQSNFQTNREFNGSSKGDHV